MKRWTAVMVVGWALACGPPVPEVQRPGMLLVMTEDGGAYGLVEGKPCCRVASTPATPPLWTGNGLAVPSPTGGLWEVQTIGAERFWESGPPAGTALEALQPIPLSTGVVRSLTGLELDVAEPGHVFRAPDGGVASEGKSRVKQLWWAPLPAKGKASEPLAKSDWDGSWFIGISAVGEPASEAWTTAWKNTFHPGEELQRIEAVRADLDQDGDLDAFVCYDLLDDDPCKFCDIIEDHEGSNRRWESVLGIDPNRMEVFTLRGGVHVAMMVGDQEGGEFPVLGRFDGLNFVTELRRK